MKKLVIFELFSYLLQLTKLNLIVNKTFETNFVDIYANFFLRNIELYGLEFQGCRNEAQKARNITKVIARKKCCFRFSRTKNNKTT